MDRSPSRLRNAGGFVTSGSPMAQPSEGGQYNDRDSMVRRSTRAADHARDQVQSALDGLLSDDAISNRSPPSRGYEPADSARLPVPSAGGRRRSYAPPEPISMEATDPQRYQSPDLRKSSAMTLDTGGYTPTAAGGRRRRSSVRSPKSYNMGMSQGQAVGISTLEGLQVFLDQKQKEVVAAHARRTKELETALAKEESYFSALLDNELERKGAKLKATAAMLKGGKSAADNLFRRGSRRLSNDGVDDALHSKHGEDIKKAEHLRKKLKAHHDEARVVLAKKLQVENARMARVIKTNLGKYANPKLAQSAKAAVLASVVEYLNGEEFERIVTAPLNYRSPDFVSSTETELGTIGVNFSPTNARQRSLASLPVEASDYDDKMAQLQEQRRTEQQQRMVDEARQQSEALARESRAAMERDTADALARADKENRWRQEELQRQQERELEEQKRQLEEHQEHLRREAEIARMRHKEELERRRAEMEREREEILARQAQAKRIQEEELARQREEMQRQHEEDMKRQRDEIARHAEEVARHKAELAKHNEEARLEQEALEEIRRRAKEEEEGEKRRLEKELARHQEEMRLEAERVKAELEALKLEREAVARAEEADRIAAEEARRAKADEDAAEARRVEEEERRRQEAEAAMRAKIEAELEERVARDIQAERDRVAAETAALEAKMREFEEQRRAAEEQRKAAEARAAEEREAALAAREQLAAEREAAVSEKAGLERAASSKGATSSSSSSRGPGPRGFRVGDSVDAFCTPVGAAAGTKAYISGEVAHRNPDGSLDIILSDGRMRQDVPLDEVKFISRPGLLSSTGTGLGELSASENGDDGDDDGDGGSDSAVSSAAWAAAAGAAAAAAAGGAQDEAKGWTADGKKEHSSSLAPSNLLDQTQSFGKLGGVDGVAETGNNTLLGSAAQPDKMAKKESLDDILGIKLRASKDAKANAEAAAEAEAASVAASRAAAAPLLPGGSADGASGVLKKKRGSLDDILGIKVGREIKGNGTGGLNEGDTVEALTSPAGDGGGPSKFMPGVIRRVHGDGRVDVELETGRMLEQRPAKEIRVVRKGRPSAASSTPLAPGDLAVGDRVEARYGGSPEFLPGVVTCTEDGVSINFDAGWHGASLPLKDVRRANTNAGSSAMPAAGGRGGERNKPVSLSIGAQMRSMGNILDLDVGSLGGDSFSVGDQIQFRNKMPFRAGPPQTHNGVVRTAHPNGSYLVGFQDGTVRDQVLVSFLTAFEWTPDGSEAYRRAAFGDPSATAAPTAAVTAAVPTQDAAVGSQANKGMADVGARQQSGAGPRGGNGGSFSKSLRKSVFDKFGSSGKVSPEGGTTSDVPQRRATHAGVVESGNPGLRLNMVHFTPQEFMDPDTAAQAILTPNNAGMFRGRPVGRQGQERGHRQVLSELSYTSTTDGESGVGKGGGGGKGGAKTKQQREAEKKAAHGGNASPFAPKRRMTFGGIRSDKRGEVYHAQRRPSFLEGIKRQAVGVAEAAAKATRRLSFQGNSELVAIGDIQNSVEKKNAKRKGGGEDGEGEESDDSVCENETHFYNRSRHVFEPQHTESSPSAWWIRTCGIINLICMATYLWWRCMRSLIGVKHIIWAYMFLVAECIMAIGMIVGHSSRSFPVHREKVFMDDLTEIDEAIGALKVAVLIPTCGEKTAVVLKALFGNLQLRLWKSKNARRDTLRVVVLDEKRREEVQKMVSLVYTLAEVVLDKTVREILMREGVAPISARGFYNHFANGEHGQRMYDDVNFIRGIEIVSEIDKLIAANDDHISRFSPSVAISRIKERARRASCFDRKEIQPGQKKVWNRNKYIPTIVYYSRIDAGQPRISPKAGNMNRSIFSFNPQEEPLIGEAAVIVVNDVRHELYPEFLQRTVPYFFTFDKLRRCYKWADIAFIQTPQRFHDRKDWNDPDPLGNQAATQFDIVNSGRDGAGGALSCGQGSVWRVQVLRDGIRPDGSKFVKKGAPEEDQVGRQGGLGFRAEVLIEDTHTSIDLFRQGWKSVYVNFPNEILACCTLPPDTVKWRWKQVLRWHQGAVQLAMWKGWGYALSGENWGTGFQKVFAFDAVSYFLQAFAGEILLIFPIVYGFTNSAPFNTWNIEFALYFFPFIITGVLPTVAALGWQKTPSAKVMRDEQIWFATSFVQIYAVLHAVWSTITRKDPSNAWNCKCPVWPLYLHFVAIIVAVCFNTIDWVKRSYEEPWVWVSCIGSAMFALHSLWPVVSFGLGRTMPEAFYTRVFGMLVVMTLVSMWLLGEGGAAA